MCINIFDVIQGPILSHVGLDPLDGLVSGGFLVIIFLLRRLNEAAMAKWNWFQGAAKVSACEEL